MPKLIYSGNWEHSTFFAYLDPNKQYDKFRQLTTAVVSVYFSSRNQIILTQQKTGKYDLLGGKSKKGESVEDTLKREAFEEAGVKLDHWQYFGYYEIFLSKNASKEYKKRYPKKSYILFFISTGQKVDEPSGKEIQNCKTFSLNKLKTSKILDHPMLWTAIKLVELGKVNFL